MFIPSRGFTHNHPDCIKTCPRHSGWLTTVSGFCRSALLLCILVYVDICRWVMQRVVNLMTSHLLLNQVISVTEGTFRHVHICCRASLKGFCSGRSLLGVTSCHQSDNLIPWEGLVISWSGFTRATAWKNAEYVISLLSLHSDIKKHLFSANERRRYFFFITQ